LAMANIFDNERIRKWTIIGAVLGGIAPIATLSENQSLTIPDIFLGALTVGSIFGFVAFGINKSNDSQGLKTRSKKSNNQSAQFSNLTNNPKFKVAIVAGFLILGLAYATNTRSELWGQSIMDVWSSPGEEVLSDRLWCVDDTFNNNVIEGVTPTECYAASGSWVRMPSSMSGPTQSDIDELMKQDLSENLHFVIMGVGVVGLLIYTTRKSGKPNR
jgi:hypothetical protein